MGRHYLHAAVELWALTARGLGRREARWRQRCVCERTAHLARAPPLCRRRWMRLMRCLECPHLALRPPSPRRPPNQPPLTALAVHVSHLQAAARALKLSCHLRRKPASAPLRRRSPPRQRPSSCQPHQSLPVQQPRSRLAPMAALPSTQTGQRVSPPAPVYRRPGPAPAPRGRQWGRPLRKRRSWQRCGGWRTRRAACWRRPRRRQRQRRRSARRSCGRSASGSGPSAPSASASAPSAQNATRRAAAPPVSALGISGVTGTW